MIQILSRNSLGINFFEDLANSPRVLFHYLNSYLSNFVIFVYILNPLQVLSRYRWARRHVALHSVEFLGRVRVQLVYSVVQVFGRCVECRELQVQIVDFVNYSAVGSWLTRFLFFHKNIAKIWSPSELTCTVERTCCICELRTLRSFNESTISKYFAAKSSYTTRASAFSSISFVKIVEFTSASLSSKTPNLRAHKQHLS